MGQDLRPLATPDFLAELLVPKSHILTRRDLYDLVWSKPMTSLAQEFGISDRGLAKTCSRHRVPVPPRGYWAKVAAGEQPPVPPFLELRDPSLDRVSIRGATSALPESVKKLAHEQRAQREKRVPKSENSEDTTLLAVTTPHAVVAKTARFLRGRKPDKEGVLRAIGPGLCGLVVSQSQAERAIAILDGLVRGFEEHGLSVTAEGDKMSVQKGEDTVGFTLVERPKRVKYISTPEETEREEKRKEKEARSWQRRGYAPASFTAGHLGQNTCPSGSGNSSSRSTSTGPRGCERPGPTARRSASKPCSPPLSMVWPSFSRPCASAAKKREEQERQWKILQHRRHLARARQDREEKRFTHLHQIIELRREARDLREWLESLPPDAVTLSSENGPGRMRRWIEERLAEIDRKTGIEAAASFAGPELFPEIDDLWDPLGDPDHKA